MSRYPGTSSSQGAPSAAVDETRQQIVASLFARHAEDGTAEETLITYIKVHEEDEGGAKTRYLILAVTKLGKCVLHKAKRNNNGTFSKGKTWQLEDVRVVEVVGPTDFALTMTVRRYQWRTERPKEQSHFLNSLVKVYRTYTKGEVPELVNFAAPEPSSSSGRSTPTSAARAASPYPAGSGIGLMSPPAGQAELHPPPPRSHRSGSASSFASSGQASFYQSERVPPSPLDEMRTPTQATFVRSPQPQPDDGFASGRRPSAADAWAPAARQYANGSAGIGLGQPPAHREERRPGTNGAEASVRSREAARRPSESGMGAPVAAPTPQPVQPEKAERPYSGIDDETEELAIPPAPGAPIIMTTEASPAVRQEAVMPPSLQIPDPEPLREPAAAFGQARGVSPASLAPSDGGLSAAGSNKVKRRASFHPPPLDTAYSRDVLLTARKGVLPGAKGMTIDAADADEDAMMANVEDMLEGFDWSATSGAAGATRKKGSADAIEQRLLDELAALDSANIHAFLESDDRIAQVLSHFDEALTELDDIDAQITGYRMQLNAVSDDIAYIESQNRGLQVQTSNQHKLLNELRQLLQITEVPDDALATLAQESPASQRGVQALEQAAASLYKALQAGRDTANAEVAATIARMQEYESSSAQFCRRVVDYLDVAFKSQVDTTFAEYRQTIKQTLALAPHTTMGEHLMTYEGFVLFVKEMDEDSYQRLCMNYIAAASQLHSNEMKELLMMLMTQLNSAGNQHMDATFASALSTGGKSGISRSKTVIGLGNRGGGNAAQTNGSSGGGDGGRVAETYQTALTGLINQVVTEDDFINAFLHIADAESTFADYMELESYFRRQAARHAGTAMSASMVQLARSVMDLVFGFIDGEVKQWVEAATMSNPVAIVGIIAVTERIAKEAEQESSNMFFLQLFQKSLGRQRQAFDTFINDQLRTIDTARAQIRRRRAVAPFVRHFHVFVERVEAQLAAADTADLDVRQRVNDAYERVIAAVLGALQQIAKVVGAEIGSGEDKGQLYFHVVMIENLHHFVEDMSHINISTLQVFLDRARGLYDENLKSYLKLMLRRNFSRLMDFFDGVERLSATTPANEISLHHNYSRSALKKVLKDTGAKDMRKAIEGLARRVDKHFYDEDAAAGAAGAHGDPHVAALTAAVWHALTAELRRETARAAGLISKSYAEAGLALEFGPGDVEAACKRAKQ
ncbi:hypothetical protein Q5752_006531 [Cryptotrichosporon argae]